MKDIKSQDFYRWTCIKSTKRALTQPTNSLCKMYPKELPGHLGDLSKNLIAENWKQCQIGNGYIHIIFIKVEVCIL